MKRILFFFIALLPAIGLYAYDFQYGDLCYNITGDSIVEVTGGYYFYDGLISLSIPDVVTDEGTTYRVTSIGD